jgi:hypothetical protein
MTPGMRPSSIDLPPFDPDAIEPDFVDDANESSGDEEEVARLARDRGFGLGGWMDQLLGWTLFSVDEASDDDDDDEDEEEVLPQNMTKEELRLRREVEARRRRLEREAIIAAAALKAREKEDVEGIRPSTSDAEDETGGGWQDAAWLLSVASKALF